MVLKNYYQTLAIEWNVGLERIKEAYQELTHQYQNQPESNFTKERLREIEEAYKTLSHSHKRQKYDIEYFLYFVKGEGNEDIDKSTLVPTMVGDRKGVIDLTTNKIEFEEEALKEVAATDTFRLVLPLLVVGITSSLVYLNVQNHQNDKTILTAKTVTTQVSQIQNKPIENKIEKINYDEILAMSSPEHNELNDYILPVNKRQTNATQKTKHTQHQNIQKPQHHSTTAPQHQKTIAPRHHSTNKPKTGTSPYKSHFKTELIDKGSFNKLHLNNTDKNDAVICLIEKRTEAVVRNIYVRSEEKHTIDHIPNGDYYLKVYYGKKWSADKTVANGIKGGFTEKEIFEVYNEKHKSFEMTQYIEDAKVHYTQYQVQLGGNEKTYKNYNITSKDFFKK